MKGTVGIVDFHAATNYGSALLCLATGGKRYGI